MHVCMYVLMYGVCMDVYVWMYVCMDVDALMYGCMSGCIDELMYVWMYECFIDVWCKYVDVCMYVCMYAMVYAYVVYARMCVCFYGCGCMDVYMNV